MSELTTSEAAERLGLTRRRVLAMLRSGELRGRRIGETWLVERHAVLSRELLGSARGRPLSPSTTRAILDALSSGAGLTERHAGLVRSRDTPALASWLARSVVVLRFASRDVGRAAGLLNPTAESALDRIVDDVSGRLAGHGRDIHGYPKGLTLEELIDEALLVSDTEGAVRVYRFRDDVFPWQETPRALVAVDATRSEQARVRAAGLDALDRMRSAWLAARMR